MEKSPMKIGYGKAPNKLGSLPKINSNGNETMPNVRSSGKSVGEKYKKPTDAGKSRLGRSADDKSTGNVNMMKQSASDKNRYKQAVQPEQYSNAGTVKKTKFVC